MQTLACLNGELMPVEEARVPVWDRGFLFGDSIYEVCRIYSGRCWLEDAHFERFRRSLEAMWFPPIDLHRLRERAARTIEVSGVLEGTLYMQVTRGVAPRKHIFPGPDVPPTELLIVRPYDDRETERLRQQGVGVMSHPDWRWKRCDVKSTNLLANVIACEAAHRAGCVEAVLVDEAGRVTEATHSSLLWVREGVLEGTPEGPEILPGTSRHHLLRLAEAAGLPFREATATLAELAACDEVILTGTTIEVLPVVRLDGQPIGDGVPGPICRTLQDVFRRDLAAWLGREAARPAVATR